MFLSGCGGQKDTRKKIYLLNNTDSPFWAAAVVGIREAVKDLKLEAEGYTALMDNNGKEETKGQIDKLKSYLVRDDIVAVGISPMDATNESLQEQLKKLKEKGVIVFCFDSDLPADKASLRDFYIGTNNIRAGKVLGMALSNLAPDGGGYAQFVGTDTQRNAVERMDGVKSALGPKFSEKERMFDKVNLETARQNVKQAITKYTDLVALVGIWSYNGPAIADTVADPALRPKYKSVTFDAEEATISQMQQGNVDVMVIQNPYMMGYYSVQTAFAKLKKDDAALKKVFPNFGQPNGDVKETNLKIVVPEKSTLKKEMFTEVDPELEFLTLPQFQEWLKKYGLTSS
jgi:ribose transport system substrate-binding protein